MARISNCFIVSLNICTMILGLVAMSSSLFLYEHGDTDCQELLIGPLCEFGIWVFVVSVLGFIGSCCRVNCVLIIYMFYVIVALVVLTVAIFSVLVLTHKEEVKKVAQLGFDENEIEFRSRWLRRHFANEENWSKIKSCLADSNICGNLPLDVNMTRQDVYKLNQSRIQSGCCMPHKHCGFEYKNGTWILPLQGPKSKRQDCMLWNNSQDKLCYDCESCKNGVLNFVKNEWRHWAIVNGCAIIFVFVIFLTACCVQWNNKEDKKNDVHRYRNCCP